MHKISKSLKKKKDSIYNPHSIQVWDLGAHAHPSLQPFPNNTNLQPLEINQSLLYRGPVDPANWFGVRKGYPNLGYIQVSGD
jgi:hypothetical protein